jgi:chromosome segregation ATPase
MEPSATDSEELQRRVEALERCLLEAQAQVESKVTELQEVRHERDELEDAVAGAEQKLSERENQLSDIRQDLDDALSSDQAHREHAERLASELELSRLQFELEKLRAMESLRAEHQSILERELCRAEELRQEKKKSEERALWLESQLQAAMQPRSTAAETEQQMDPLESVSVTTHHPSTGYSVAVEEQRAGSVSPTCYYYPARKVEQEPLQTLPQMVSMHQQEMSNES